MPTPFEYWQRNPIHADKHYGMLRAAPASTIGTQGCKLCGYGYTLGILPAELQDIFALNGCYANDPARYYNYILDEAVAYVFRDRIKYNGRVDCQSTPAPLTLVSDQVARNGFCLVYVDARKNMTAALAAKYTQYFQHYVVVVDDRKDGYMIFDPYVGDIAPLTRYGRTGGEAIGGVLKIDRVAPVEIPIAQTQQVSPTFVPTLYPL